MIENEYLLIDALMSLVGDDNLLVFTGGSMDTHGLIRQATIFSNAKVVLGMLEIGLTFFFFFFEMLSKVLYDLVNRFKKIFQGATALG